MIMASGSKGNCTFIESNENKILIDLGISRRKIMNSLQNINVNVDEISHVFITHEHTDHIGGLATFFNYSDANLYVTNGTLYSILKSKNQKNIDVINKKIANNTLTIFKKNDVDKYLDILLNDICITPIHAFHDAYEPVGYVLQDEKNKLVYLTDTGYIHEGIMSKINNADCYILECNHDPEILMNSDRPYEIKMRILGNHGHLSNEDALYALAMSVGPKTKYVFYAHISEECNIPEIVDLTRKKVFNSLGIVVNDVRFSSTSQECSELIEI